MIKDRFVTDLIGFECYIAYKKILTKQIKDIKKPFFLTIKSKKKLVFRSKSKAIKINLISKLVYFERNFKKKQLLDVKCRNAKKNDIKQISNIAKENHLNSRFILDKLIPVKFKKEYRSEWVKNFFKKTRGDYLLVAYKNNTILGFVLTLKKKKTICY